MDSIFRLSSSGSCYQIIHQKNLFLMLTLPTNVKMSVMIRP